MGNRRYIQQPEESFLYDAKFEESRRKMAEQRKAIGKEKYARMTYQERKNAGLINNSKPHGNKS